MDRASVYQLTTGGRLRGSKLGRGWIIRGSDVVAYMAVPVRKHRGAAHTADHTSGCLGTREAAAVLGVSQTTVGKLVRDGRLTAERLGRRAWVIQASDVAALTRHAEARRAAPSPTTPSSPRGVRRGGPPPAGTDTQAAASWDGDG